MPLAAGKRLQQHSQCSAWRPVMHFPLGAWLNKETIDQWSALFAAFLLFLTLFSDLLITLHASR
jgi:hypothetical protein